MNNANNHPRPFGEFLTASITKEETHVNRYFAVLKPALMVVLAAAALVVLCAVLNCVFQDPVTFIITSVSIVTALVAFCIFLHCLRQCDKHHQIVERLTLLKSNRQKPAPTTE